MVNTILKGLVENRNPQYTQSNIPLNESYFYRGVDVPDWESLFDEEGIMQGYGKGGTNRLSFQKGAPNDLYVNGLVKSNHIIEADDTLNPDEVEDNGYTYKDKIDRRSVENGEIHLRIWKREMGHDALELSHIWEPVFDSFPKENVQE